MRRRTFFPLLGGAATAWPLRTFAQQPGAVKRIAYIHPAFASPVVLKYRDTWLKTLTALGWSEGRTVAIDYRWGEGNAQRLRQLVAQAVADKVDLLVAIGPAAFTARDATNTSPIVALSLEIDPVADGLVQSLARPGGNITGVLDRKSVV